MGQQACISYLQTSMKLMAGHGNRPVWAWRVFARSEVVIVGSNPTLGMDDWCVCVRARVYSVFVLSCI
jgi:hypothetical protein